jgi:DNA-binding winged helix-turn-helix (wHTH) protein
MSATHPQVYEFGPFRLDHSEHQLWCGGKPVALTEKVFELLALLVQSRGRTMTKAELMAKLWPDTVVEENNLTVQVSALRKALGEAASERRYIQTLARRGYRFVADVRTGYAPAVESSKGAPAEASVPSQHPRPAFVGRERELALLERSFAGAVEGCGRVMFISGGPGMGKTALCEQFTLRTRASGDAALIATGHCLEHYGACEAYLPFLEAVQALLSGADGELVRGVFERHAPHWCSQFPALLPVVAPRVEERGSSPARMLGELCDALTASSQLKPLVLVLEDLHWADPSSSDLLHLLAQRVGRSRVLVIGTFRAEQVELDGHALKNIKRELLAHDQCDELTLPLLEAPCIEQYLDARLEQHDLPSELAALIYRTSEGQPLFATRLVQLLLDRGDIQVQDGRFRLTRDVAELHPGVPDNVRGLIERKLESLLDAQRRALAYASVNGSEFTSATLASVLGEDEMLLEERLGELARAHRMLELCGEERLPDGRITLRYRFAHVLYQNVLYESLGARRRMALHGQIADALLEQYGDAVPRISAQLAAHFTAARRAEPAIRFLMAAGDNAARLHANRESQKYYADALVLVSELPRAERTAHDIILQYNLGWMHSHVGEHENALCRFEAMLERARDVAFTGGTAEAQRAREIVFGYFEEPWRDAFGMSEHARMPNQDRSFGPAAIQAEAYWCISMILSSVDRWQEFGVRTAECLELAAVSHNEPRRLEALTWMAMRELELGRLSAAAGLLDEALPAARRIGHSRALFFALHLRGHLDYLRSDDEASEALFVESLPLAIEAMGRIRSLLGMVRARASSGRISAALDAFNEALDLCRRIENELMPQLLHGEIGDMYLELGLPARALAEHTRALEIAQRQALRAGQIHAHIGLARGYRMSFDAERARTELAQAQQLLYELQRKGEPLSNRYFQDPRLALDAAWAAERLHEGSLDAAERHALDLLAAADRSGSARHAARAYHALASVELLRGQHHSAEARAQSGLAALGEQRHPFSRIALLTTVGAIRQRAGLLTGAAAARTAAGAIVDELSASILDPKLRADWLASPHIAELVGHAAVRSAS